MNKATYIITTLSAAFAMMPHNANCASSAPSDDTAPTTLITEVHHSQLPEVVWGDLHRYTAHCEALDADFTVDVLLPEGYDENKEERYPVIYMHDGQNLFDAKRNWNGQSWDIDDALAMLTSKDVVRRPIIVGVHNRGELRPSDLIPEKVCREYINADDRLASGMWTLTSSCFNGDEYAEFIARKLKPAIDEMFMTLNGPQDTFVMGSSMGGLASIYAMCEYPDVYGGAACLSTHWIGDFNYSNKIFPEAMLAYMADVLPDASAHKLYFDRGTKDLDSAYSEWEPKAHSTAMAKGYSKETSTLMTYLADGATHNETCWSQRVDRPLYFLIGNGNYYDPDASVNDACHVVFQDARYNWTNPHAFTWAAGTTDLQLGTWPGTPMTATSYNGEPAWEITFDSKIKPTHIIFNNGLKSGTVQTGDLKFENNSVYNFNGTIASISISPELRIDNSMIEIRQEGHKLVIVAKEPTLLEICGIDGRGTKFKISEGENSIDTLVPGLYFVEGRKTLVK